MPHLTRPLMRVRSVFYNFGGPWYRRGFAESLGSQRYSRPAMFGLDRRLEELMPWRDGTFLEAGGHDGYTQSNTYFLERHRGWSGVLVEPVPELYEKCSRRRPHARVFGCALVGPDYQEPSITIHFGDLMSTTGPAGHTDWGLAVTRRQGYSMEVPARTLSSVIEEAALPGIDLMVLDVEGQEAAALRGLDLERHGPRYLLLESLEPERDEQVFGGILGERYELIEMASRHDFLFRRRE